MPFTKNKGTSKASGQMLRSDRRVTIELLDGRRD